MSYRRVQKKKKTTNCIHGHSLWSAISCQRKGLTRPTYIRVEKTVPNIQTDVISSFFLLLLFLQLTRQILYVNFEGETKTIVSSEKLIRRALRQVRWNRWYRCDRTTQNTRIGVIHKYRQISK